MNFEKIISQISSKQDFVRFVEILNRDLLENQESWANSTLEDYLEALARWTEDMEYYYLNNNLAMPKDIDWKVFANALIAAKMYE